MYTEQLVEPHKDTFEQKLPVERRQRSIKTERQAISEQKQEMSSPCEVAQSKEKRYW